MSFNFDTYFKEFSKNLFKVDEYCLIEAVNLIKTHSKMGGKLIFIGNGGSAAISSHVAVDFTKACKIRSITFNEADLLTCFSNDYGYENWALEALSAYADPNDLVILISSSGTSQNILNAANYCIEKKLSLITFSGFSKLNPLKNCGKINFHVNSNIYNFVEMIHHTWLVGIVDYIAGVDFEKK